MTSSDTKENLRNQIQKFLYSTSSANPQFVEFLETNIETLKSYLHKNNLFQKREHQNLSEKEMLKINVDRYVHAFKLSQQMKQSQNIYKRVDYLFPIMGITLNTAAFLNTIQLLGDEKQSEIWKNKVLTGQVFGGYGQTQLGHGSNVQGLQTEAHYDEIKQTFKINSPQTSSAKFWPGVLGMAATHVVLQAKTFVKGKKLGIQTFIFETRDQNLKPLPGVKAGDIGPKFGFHRVDNGYLLVDNVQIPRENMLMRYVQVTPTGEVIGLQNKQAIKYAYGSMLFLRVALPFLFCFSHITTPTKQLYSLYEQMGIQNKPANRQQIINYMSLGQGIVVANVFALKLFNIYSDELKAKNFQKADKVLMKCHVLSATFKALSSWKALKVSTQMATRNQFTVFRTTGLPYSLNNITPSVTYEGDNSVLLQQTAKFILMKDKGEQLKKPNINVKDNDLAAITLMLRYVTSSEIRRLKKIIQKQIQQGVGFKTIWNEKHQKQIIQVSLLWGVRQLIDGFVDSLKDIPEHLKGYFTKIGKVFAKNLLEDTPQIYTYGFKIEETQSWKQFTDVQYWAMANIDRPLGGLDQPHKLLQRPGSWFKAKL